jgi:hypothetical protein
LYGQNRIYAVVSSAVTLNGVQYQKGQLLSYVDNGQPGNVSDPVIVGFGGWEVFEFVFAGTNLYGQNRIYAVVSSAVTLNGVQYQKGQLLSYVDNGQPGNVSDPVIVGFDDWTDFKFLFGGTNLQDQPCIYGVWALATPPTPPPGESLYSIASSAYTNNIVTIGTGQ